eukprot:GHVR01170627.1.p1 GENE.GHVR01170627.1~~GHVR01170627.1.p1  ORF type:complete len:223 (+),score=39.93 GHVR01170627.1:62-730(+)
MEGEHRTATERPLVFPKERALFYLFLYSFALSVHIFIGVYTYKLGFTSFGATVILIQPMVWAFGSVLLLSEGEFFLSLIVACGFGPLAEASGYRPDFHKGFKNIGHAQIVLTWVPLGLLYAHVAIFGAYSAALSDGNQLGPINQLGSRISSVCVLSGLGLVVCAITVACTMGDLVFFSWVSHLPNRPTTIIELKKKYYKMFIALFACVMEQMVCVCVCVYIL